MKLVIVESPNKCETISSFLGEGYKVVASKGNIRDLATSGKDGLGVDVENNFKPTYRIDKDKYATVNMLRAEARKADEILLATDPDREGEAISWHLSQVLNLDPSETKRLSFHEITRPAISQALSNPSTIDMKLVDSQETRRIYDRVIGFKLSKLLQHKIKCKSAGRVQSATLKLIIDNDRARKSFVPTEYYVISILINKDGKEVEANLCKPNGEPLKIESKEEAEKIFNSIGKSSTVVSLKVEEKKIQTKQPLTTSSLAQEAFNRFHFTTNMTTVISQKLFEGLTIDGKHVGLITYHRTDSTRVSPVFYETQAKPFILNKFGKEYLGPLRKEKNGANAQDAHEAIRPTDISLLPSDAEKYLNPNEAKLYRLIYERAVGSLMTAKVVEGTNVIFETNGLTFSATGSRTIFKGYEAIGELEKDEESKSLPKFSEGEELVISNKKNEQKFTQPPAPISEARLVRMMEKEGIGRPSTYNSTIQTLLKRDYITSEKGILTPTDYGYKSIQFLEKYFAEIVTANYTAGMESKLDEIQEGNETKLNALTDFYFPFISEFEKVYGTSPKDPDPEPVIIPDKICPKCGSPIVERKSRYGVFYACSNYPKCDYIEKSEKAAPKETGELCPLCGKPLVERKNKKGETFVGCSNFPKCHYIKGSENVTPKYTEEDYVKECPKCHSGHLILRHSKRGDFLGCTNYPKCKYHEFPEKPNDDKGN